MKRHKSFDAYFNSLTYKPAIAQKIKLLMMDAWTNARYGYIDTQPVEPKKRTILHFKNGASVELTEKHNTSELWKATSSVLIEQWFTVEEFAKLYPKKVK